MNFYKLTYFILIGHCVAGCINNKTPPSDSKTKPEATTQVDSFEILRPSLWVYGMAQEEDRQRQIVDDWYKFRFRIIAGCMVTDGSIKRANPIRLIRDGIVVYVGKLGSLKRHKDDASEVKTGFDCGIGIDGFNDMQVGDVIESYEQREVKRTL